MNEWQVVGVGERAVSGRNWVVVAGGQGGRSRSMLPLDRLAGHTQDHLLDHRRSDGAVG